MYILKVLAQAQKDLDRFPPKMFEQMIAVLNKLPENPRPYGSIKLTHEESHRIRVGDYRLLYRIDDEVKTIFVYRIKHRKDVYR